MNMISRIALKIVREYLADSPSVPYDYDQSNQLYVDKKSIQYIVDSAMHEYGENLYAYYQNVDVSQIIRKIAQTYNLQVSAGTTQINICFMPKDPKALQNAIFLKHSKNLSIERCQQIISDYLGAGLGITTPNNQIYIATSIQSGNGQFVKRDKRHLLKTLRHEMQHFCQHYFGLTDAEIETLNEQLEYSHIKEYSKRRQIARYKNDLFEDINECRVPADFFIDFCNNYIQSDITQIENIANTESTKWIRQNNHPCDVDNVDLYNDLLFLYSVHKYNRTYYNRVFNHLKSLA